MFRQYFSACQLYLVLAALLVWPGLISAQTGFDSGKSRLRVQYQDRILSYAIESLAVLPDETVRLEMTDPQPAAECIALKTQTPVAPIAAGSWIWQAPSEPGLRRLLIQQPDTGYTMTIHVFVMVPFQAGSATRIKGYRIGNYPRRTVHSSVLYQPPRGFIRVTQANQATQVSPHFQLRQFACKQSDKFPQYLLLDPKLVVKCEQLVERLNRAGYPCQTLVVMSGYRTPYYNRRLGNVRFSSHVWGRAADVYVDEDRDGLMDDLNQDGKNNYRDAAILYKMIDRMDGQGAGKTLVGGLGLYAKNRNHGPFVHLDVRGKKARWGIAVQKPVRAGK